MPNRILRDWTDSDRFDGLSAEAERLFVRLLMKTDDYGRFHAEARRLKAALFPLVETLRLADISKWLSELVARGLIVMYVADNRELLAIRKFRQRLKQSVPKFPPPTGEPENWLPADFPELPGTTGVFDPKNASQGTSRNFPSETETETETETESETETETETETEALIGDGDVSCGEPASQPPAEPSMEFPCVGPTLKTWGITQAKIDEYSASFPGCDVLAECRKARQWCIDNPTKRKTHSGMPKFLTNWLIRQQEKGVHNGNGSHRNGVTTPADARRVAQRAREAGGELAL